MKKLKITAAVFALMAIIFTGCSNKDITIDINELADDLKNSVSFADTLEEPVNLAYSDIDEADLKDKKIYISTGATAEEIAVYEAVDQDAANRILKAVESYIDDQIDEFEDYNPDEVKKLNDPVIVKVGKYVILCVSDDNVAAKDCIKKYTK
jgi:hypothetical protein